MKKEIYTIGYSGFSLDDFIKCLKHYKISSLIDVRSTPFSQYFQEYNKDYLQKKLKSEGIIYRNYREEFGARQTNIEYYPNGYLDFNLFTKSFSFLQGIEKIEKGINLGYVFALMCAEKDPISCHRNIMVGKAMAEMGFLIKHIHADCSLENQEEIEERMLKEYFPERNQLSFFEENQSDEDLIRISYERKNREIGYKIAEDEEQYE